MDETIKTALTVVLFFFAVCIVLALVRAVTGKKPADRLVAVNMITTIVVMITIVLSVLLDESWLADIAAIYALISFVGVIVFSKLHISSVKKRAQAKEDLSREGSMHDGD
ncbi:MAG: sodium:proton antiporter [Lachnospiraceae bacterium]|nr:sodium:proton antiporter [Lachnospiraceae bacterium]